ncbi:MAG: hypothetical protein ACTHMM_10270 [Agriterribacter sp.]
MNKLHRYIIYSGILLGSLKATAQSGDAALLQQQFSSYTEHNLTEKIYLHTDRNFYIPGEIVWFKAYLFNEISHHASAFSKVAYVDVINHNNKPFLQAKIALNDGLGNGSLYLPVNLPSGNYKIRAYTNWMKNFDAGFYFEKAITVVNTTTAAGLPQPDTTAKYDIQFFPEGGTLLKNVQTKIAFRITDQHGKGIQQCKGMIIGDQHETLTTFAPYAFGIGSFSFTPRTTGNYTAQILLPTGDTLTKALPPAHEAGYSMQLQKNTNGQLGITVTAANIGANSTIYLFAHTRGIIKQVTAQTVQNNKAFFNIGANVPGDGITHFTIFNSNKQPVCERIYFAQSPARLSINATATETEYARRKKVTVNISSSNATSTNMSLAVYRIDSLQSSEHSDIYSYLWLSSDIKGNIESPAWYFSTTADSAATGIDNLMLTHGWRRFKWQEVQQPQKPAFAYLPEYSGHIINGRLTDTATRKPFAESTVFLSVPGSYTQFYAARSDEGGNLRFYTHNAYGPGELIAQAEGLNGASYNVEIASPFSEKYSQKLLPPFVINERMKYALQQNSMNAQVLRKFATEQIRQYRFPDVDTSAFFGKPDERYLLDDYTRFTTMEEVLREYVLGVMVGRSGGKFKLMALDIPNNRLFKDNPLVLLDGVPVLDMDKIMSYDPLKVRKIELVKRRYYYGPLLLDGIVSMTTYKGNMDEFPMDPKAVILDYDGLQLQREFYSPVYETEAQQNSRLADYRNLLFWSPEIITGKDGRTSVSFYTSDLTGKYKAVIEGVTANGQAGSNEFGFEVK